MARVTVEDCLSKISNRFELVLTAGHRAKQILDSGTTKIDSEGSKADIVALREIAEGLTDKKVLKEPIMSEMSRERGLREMMHSKLLEMPVYDEDDEFAEMVDGDSEERAAKDGADEIKDPFADETKADEGADAKD